jgi:hypothetical protein
VVSDPPPAEVEDSSYTWEARLAGLSMVTEFRVRVRRRIGAPGQHFAGGEQATAMPPDMVDGGVGTVRVEVTDGVLDQVNEVAALDQAAGRAVDTDFRDHTVKNDLAVAQQFQKESVLGFLNTSTVCFSRMISR